MNKLHEADVESVLAGIGVGYKPQGPRHFSFCCPFHGEKNPSARIDRDGSGGEVQFKCFACGEQGTVAKLVGHVLGFGEDWSKSYDWIRNRCGLEPERQPGQPSRKRTTPGARDQKPKRRSRDLDVKLQGLHQALLASTDVLEWLARRGVTKSVVEEHRLGFLTGRHEWLVIPLPNGSVKLRAWNKQEGQPKYRYMEAGSSPCCYPDDGGPGEVVIVESEFDALVLRSWGVNAVSTLGSSNMTARFLEPTLQKCDSMIVLPDFDQAGFKAAESLQRQASAAGHRVMVVWGEENPAVNDVGRFVETMGHEGAEEFVKRLLGEAEDAPDLGWEEKLDVKESKDGSVKSLKTWHNINTIAENDPWMRQFWMNTRSMTLHREARRVNNESDELEVLVHFEKRHDIRLSKADAFTAISRAAENNKRDLVRESLDLLPEWDGKERLDRFIGEVINPGRKAKPIERVMFRKWMIQALRRAHHRGCKAEQVLILISEEQGIGKSTLGRILAGDEFFSDSFGSLHDKDTRLQAHGYWIIELSELDHAFHREKSAAAWRNFFSVQADDIRPAYARCSVQMPRGYVFIATTNNVRIIREDFARRYWPIRAASIDIEKARSWRDQVLAEARAAMKAGEPHFLEGEEIAAHQEHIEDFRESSKSHLDVLEEVLDRMMTIEGHRVVLANGGVKCLRLSDIAAELHERGIRLSRQDLGAQLQEVGWEKRNRRLAEDGKQMKLWAPGEGVR